MSRLVTRKKGLVPEKGTCRGGPQSPGWFLCLLYVGNARTGQPRTTAAPSTSVSVVVTHGSPAQGSGAERPMSDPGHVSRARRATRSQDDDPRTTRRRDNHKLIKIQDRVGPSAAAGRVHPTVDRDAVEGAEPKDPRVLRPPRRGARLLDPPAGHVALDLPSASKACPWAGRQVGPSGR